MLINAGSELTLRKGQRKEEAHHSTVFIYVCKACFKNRLLLLDRNYLKVLQTEVL